MMQKLRSTPGSVRPGAGADGMGTDGTPSQGGVEASIPIVSRSAAAAGSRRATWAPYERSHDDGEGAGSARDGIDARGLQDRLDLERREPWVLAPHQRDHGA